MLPTTFRAMRQGILKLNIHAVIYDQRPLSGSTDSGLNAAGCTESTNVHSHTIRVKIIRSHFEKLDKPITF